ncbi:aminoglycoside phosphotransferase [Actinoplanes sp. NPDC049596]|uniref:aminoglycoside phosphotransferase n=1 Tax=unclassified Actinoplanes TaxID=2626549 RepID=UPI0034446309
MVRAFLTLDDVSDLVAGALGRPPSGIDRLTGGTKKGVYRLRFGDETTAILYSWADAENYWPPAETVPDDPFTDASGLELFTTNHAALAAARVRVPAMLWLDRDAGLVIVEDAGREKLEALIERDPAAAEGPLAELGESLRRMHTTVGSSWGRLTDLSGARPAADVILDRALSHLAAVAPLDERLTAAAPRIDDHLRRLHAAIEPRAVYGLVHGELGPDHVLIGPAGEPVMIDIEGLTYFDVEWEHAFVRMRFGPAYERLRPVELDPDRLEFYRYAQVLALIEGPLRIAATDFPDRAWMLDLAEWNIAKALDLPQ